MARMASRRKEVAPSGGPRLPVCAAAGLLILHAAACTPSSRHVAVTSGADGTVLVYDADLRSTDTLPLPADGSGRRVGAWLAYDGTTLFAAHARARSGSVERARLADGAVLERVDFYAGTPLVAAPLFDGRTVLAVTVDDPGASAHSTLHFLGLDLASRTAPIPVCDARVLGLATVRPNDRVYLLCVGDRVIEVDRRLQTLIRTVQLPLPAEPTQAPCGASDVGIASTGSIVFVLCAGTGRLLYLDHVTLEPIDSLDVGAGGMRLARTPDGRHAVVTRPGRQDVVVADVRRRTIVGRVATDQPPLAVVADADSRTAFVTTGTPGAPGRLFRIDLPSATVLTDVPTVTMPVIVSAWPGEESPVMRWSR